MKIRPRDPTHRLSIDITSLLRKLNLRETINLTSPKQDTLIVIANGTPDNEAITLLLHLHNGKHTVDIAFPKYKHIKAAQILHEYLKENYTKILLILDQEEWQIDKIHEHLKKNIIGIKNYKIDKNTKRLATAEIEHGTKQAKLIIVINGLDIESLKKHTIEDHLLTLTKELLQENIKLTGNPKQLWQQINKNKRLKIYNEMLKHKNITLKHFKQHNKAIALIKQNNPK